VSFIWDLSFELMIRTHSQRTRFPGNFHELRQKSWIGLVPKVCCGIYPVSRTPQIPVRTEVPINPVAGGLLSGPALETEIILIGSALVSTLQALVDAIPTAGSGPVALAAALGQDKVFASRLLKSLRAGDAIASLYFMPGPEPLQRGIRAAAKRGVSKLVCQPAMEAATRFEWLIEKQVGDRSLLDSILSAWIPEARAEFELRRKQAAFKAMSQLKGAQAETILATCILAPSREPDLMDVIWVHGLTGLHRVRPGVTVKIASRRMSSEPKARRPMDLDLKEIDGTAAPLVQRFCSQPVPPVGVHRVQDAMFYTLGGDGFGAASAVDVYFAEVNLAEIKSNPAAVTFGLYFFAEAAVPAKALQFDMVVHDALFNGDQPSLKLHDTVLEGVADVFDARRDLDRFDMLESVQSLGRGPGQLRSTRSPAYAPLMRMVSERLGYDSAAFRSYRCAIDYPIYGSQVSMAFAARK
jgi:hypothetical protein